MGNTNNKTVETECEICKKDLRHEGPALEGTNKRGNITANLLNALGQKAQEHIFYRKVQRETIRDAIQAFCTKKEINQSQELYLQVPDPIEGHHLITCEAVKETIWFELFYQHGYDINCPQNGVLLPGDMLVACHFKVPLHKGGHGATASWNNQQAFNIEKNYVQLVEDLIGDMKKGYKVKDCKPVPIAKIKAFHKKMLTKSNLIFDEVISFNWLISADGMHYHSASKIGCYDNCRTIAQKRKLMGENTGIKKSSNENTIAYAIRVVENYTGKTCPVQRDHSNHGCKKQNIDWETQSRYNKPDKEIENLEEN